MKGGERFIYRLLYLSEKLNVPSFFFFMKKKDELLEIAFISNEEPLPTNFGYTCCCFVPPSNMLQNPPFSAEKALAAGTQEGCIVLFRVSKSSIDPISLLYGHNSCISDLIPSLLFKQFISVSLDGTICIWCAKDASCINKYEKAVKPGDLHLRIHPVNPSFIWCIRKGFGADLFDLSAGNVVLTIDEPGLRYLSFMTPANTFFIKEQSVVTVATNVLKLCKIGDNNEVTVIRADHISSQQTENYISTQFGVLRLKDRSFSFIYERGNSKEIELEIPEDDSLACATWYSKRNLVVATFGGLFFLVTLNHVQKGMDKVTIESIKKMKFNDVFVSSDVDYTEEGIAFISGRKDVCFLDYETEKCISFIPDKHQKKHIYNIPITDENTVLHSCDSCGFEAYDWLDKTKEVSKYETKAKVTSLFALPVRYKNYKYMILAGCEDGTVSMFWPNCPNPAKVVDAVSSSVVKFTKLNMKIGGRDPVIVFGEDGSAAIIKWLDIVIRYPGSVFPITEVYVKNEQSFLLFKHSDDRLIAYSMKDSRAVETLSTLPERCTKVYPITQEIEEYDTLTSSISFNKSSTFFTKIRVNGLDSANPEENMLTNYIIFRLLSPETKVTQPEIALEDNENESLVIVGPSNTYTFFYSNFALTSPSIFQASPKIAGTHFIAWTIISSKFTFSKPKYLPDQNVPEFLPVLTLFLNHSNKDVRETASITCAKAISLITTKTAQEIVNPYISSGKNISTEPEMFIFSMIVVAQPSTIPESLHTTLFNFLIQRMLHNDEGAALAIVILLDGFDFWEKVEGTDNILLTILRELISVERSQHVVSIFSLVAGRKLAKFSHAFDKIVEENCFSESGHEVIKRLFSVTRNVAFANVEQCGTSASLRIAHVATKYPKLQSLVSEEIGHHAQNFKNVVKSKSYYIIAVKGNVSVFKKGSLVFSLNLFNTQISHLSISPSEQRCCAISIEERMCKIFNLVPKKMSLIGMRRPVIEKEFAIENNTFELSVEWNEKDECIIKNE